MIMNNQTSSLLFEKMKKKICSSKIKFKKLIQDTLQDYTFVFEIEHLANTFCIHVREVDMLDEDKILYIIKKNIEEYILYCYFDAMTETITTRLFADDKVIYEETKEVDKNE